MKKLKKLIKELGMAKGEILKVLAYGLSIVWYGFTLRIITKANIGIFPTILLFIGGIVLGLFTFISLYNAFSEDDE